ncbi:MAG TPA: S41 family peptidase, partial [Bacteroidales bacterium]|nr:S41 family peptidase [Bacteroidales bacterium]
MKYQNSLKQILLPIVIILIFVVGAYVGRGMAGFSYINRNGTNGNTDKVSTLLNYIESEYVDSVSREGLNEDIIPQLLENLDPHSVYIAESEVSEHNEPLEGNFEGIGIQFNMVHDTLVVLQIIPLGPSEKAGLLNGDRIISVENESIAGKGLTSDEIIKKLKGKRLTEVTVGIKRQGVKNALSFTIIRDKIPIYSVDASFLLAPGTGYIKINKFARTTHSEFVNAITELNKDSIKNIVIDLRGNSGGYMESAISIADEFLTDNELIVYTKGKSRAKTDYFA